MSTPWLRVSRESPCPVCQKPDWCGTAIAGTVVHCMRVPSGRLCSSGGWIHGASAPMWTQLRPVVSPPVVHPARDFNSVYRRYVGDVRDRRLDGLALQLGVADVALVALGLGWTGRNWSFPMFDQDRQCVGIRLRTPGGRKFAERGSKEGVFLPSCPLGGPLLITEGPTDAAAMLGLGFDVCGRPSCLGGVNFSIDLARGRDAIVVADRDEAGRRGARVLAMRLLCGSQSVRVIEPPQGFKDVREWVKRGGVHRDDVLHLIDNAKLLAFEANWRSA